MSAIEKFQESTDLFRQAEILAKSGIVPAVFRGKPADVLAATLWGAELGLGAMSSLMLIEPIKGTPSMKAEGRLALIRRAGHSVTFDANDKRCIAKGKRRDTGDEATVTYTIEDAKKAKLAGKDVWQQYTEDMLFNRAISRLSRRLFSDVFMGLSYAPEEVASFAAPELLDTHADALAGNGELPQGQGVGAERGNTSGGAPAPTVVIDGHSGEMVNVDTGEIIDAEVVDEPQTLLQAGLRATEQRRSFAPPTRRGTPTPVDVEPAVDDDAVKALKARVDAVDAFDKDALRDEWKAAKLPSPNGPDPKWTEDALRLADTLVAKYEKGDAA